MSSRVGHVVGTSPSGRRARSECEKGAEARQASALSPRLLSLEQAASYLGVSTWTVRDLEAAGTIARVRVPLANHGELRKILFDREDLDRLIEAWKGSAH